MSKVSRANGSQNTFVLKSSNNDYFKINGNEIHMKNYKVRAAKNESEK